MLGYEATSSIRTGILHHNMDSGLTLLHQRVTSATSPHFGFSRAAFIENSNAMVSKRKRVQIWRPLDPAVVSGPKNCQEAITRYAEANCRGVSRSLAVDVRKHLLFLGWKIEYIDKKGVVVYRYTSPEGKIYLSLVKVCEDLRVASPFPTPDEEHCRMDSGRSVDSGPRKPEDDEKLDDSTDDDNDDDYDPGKRGNSTSPPLLRVRKKYSPQAVVDWYMIGVDKTYNVVKKSDVKIDAVGHLLALGWKLYDIQKKEGRRELRYKSPTGKVYISLRRACKGCIDQGGATSSVPGLHNMATTAKKDDDEDLNRAPKVRRGKELAFLRKQKDGGVQRSTQKVPRLATMVTASSSHRNPRTVLSWLIDNDIVLPRDKVCYKAGKAPLLWGRISREGIKCDCCSKVFGVSSFEVHAGSTKRRPAANIFLEDGRSLLDCQKQMNQMRNSGKSQQPAEVNHSGGHDQSDNVCSVCNFGGELVICDNCPATFHCSCLDLKDIPSGEWFCPSCCCGICGQGRFENGGIASDGDQFLNCVQCELSYHIGCLKSNGALDDSNIQNVNRENWFCTRNCENIHLGLQKLLGKQIPVGENLTWTLVKCTDSDGQNPETAAADTDAAQENHSRLSVAIGVLHECFQPVKEPLTQNDLVEDVIFSRKSELKRLNFRGFYTVLLERNDEIITVATVRVYGEKVAEVPLVATRFQYRRLGMCRILMDELEAQLLNLGVERLALPAVPAVLHTWTGGFGFSEMTESDRSQLLKYTFLNFQDTIMCHKQLIKNPPSEWRPEKRMKQTAAVDNMTDAMDYEGWSSTSDLSDQLMKFWTDFYEANPSNNI